MESYQHVFPICKNTPTVSSTVRSRTLSRQPKSLPSNLVGQVIEHLLDRPALDSDHAVFLAGLIISFNSTTLCYLVKYTDGTTATLTADVVKTLLLPPDPVGVSD